MNNDNDEERKLGANSLAGFHRYRREEEKQRISPKQNDKKEMVVIQSHTAIDDENEERDMVHVDVERCR